MEKENRVSVWIGDFDSEKELNTFVKDIYDEDFSSFFMNVTDIEFYDSYKREVFFSNKKITESVLKQFSYSDSFIDQLAKKLNEEDFNSIIFLYDFEYNSKINNNKLKFVGVFDYSKNTNA